MFGASLPEWLNTPLTLAGGLVLAYLVLRVGRYLEGRSSLPVSQSAVDQVVNQSAEAAASGRERRRHRRWNASHVLVEIQVTGAEELIQGMVADYPSGGLRLLADQELSAGQFLKVRASMHPQATWVSVEVRHCRAEKAKWSLGCMFLEKVPWEQVEQFC